MAKPYQNATTICVIFSVIALIGIIWGIKAENALIPMLALLPTIGYEVYRTEGKSTKMASWGLLIVFLVEVFLIITKSQLNWWDYIGGESGALGEYLLPFESVTVIAPVIMGILASALFKNTRGIYTKWLSVIIIITAFATIYIIEPTLIKSFVDSEVREEIQQAL